MNIVLKDKKSDFIKYVLVAFAAISLFCLSYNIFKTPVAKNSMLSYLKEIQDINNSCKVFIKDNTLDYNKALKNIPALKENLNKVKETTNISSETQLQAYTDAINNNILIYEQIELMLKNPMAKDNSISVANLKNYYDTANSNYSLLVKDANILGELSTAIKLTNNYCLDKSNTKKVDKIQSEQNEIFVTTLDTFVSSFNDLKSTDLLEIVSKARNNEMTYELALSELDNHISKFSTLCSELKKLSIPNGAVKSYEKLNLSIDEYGNYLESFKHGLSMEKVYSKNEKKSKKMSNALYDNSKSYLDNCNEYYSKFLSFYKEYKSKYL
ncbi:hypothetical protein [Clostridium ihumii]|uniref:hypothetical protein n=1 Tax=Clostridium ihumii TaxID=1470356 RepID=UPI00058CD82E|nr:hypothetical protein [Clostridium ihumii]